ALDQLMSGSYGNCSECGAAINEIQLDTDPATSICLECSVIKPVPASGETSATTDVVLESLSPFDTILLQTENSEYRILLLDPKTGRARVDGGNYLLEPSEGLVKGSALPGSVFNRAAISARGRSAMWVDARVFLTSPLKSV